MRVACHSLEVLVHFPGRDEPEVVHFDATRPLQGQLEGHCSIRGVPYDEDEKCQVLVLPAGQGQGASAVLGSAKQLRLVPPRVVCELRPGVEAAHALLLGLEAATQRCEPGPLVSILGALLQSICGSPWLAEEVVLQEGMHLILQALVRASPSGAPLAAPGPGGAAEALSRAAELAAACLGELLQYQNGLQWCEEQAEEALNAEAFAALLRVVLAVAAAAAPPRAALNTLLLLLTALPAVAVAGIHKAASNSAWPDGGGGGGLYAQLLEACVEMGDAWRGHAAATVICALAEACEQAPAVLSPRALEQAMLASAKSCAMGAGDPVVGMFRDAEERAACWTQQLLADSMAATNQAACSTLEAEVVSSRGVPGAAPDVAEGPRIALLDKRLQRLKDELQRKHTVMQRMAALVDVGEHVVLRQCLEAIVQNGFDSVPWTKGYTALHYTAERVDNLELVGLFCQLATNAGMRDADGMTPADYARQAGRPQAAALIEDLQHKRESKLSLHAPPPPTQTLTSTPQPPTQTLTAVSQPLQKSVRFSVGAQAAVAPPQQEAPREQTAAPASEVCRIPAPPSEVCRMVSELPATSLRRATTGTWDDPQVEPLQNAARSMRGYLSKFPTSGAAFWKSTQKRFFAVTYVPFPPLGVTRPHFELGYWETEEAFQGGTEAKGAVNMRHITAVLPDSVAGISIRYQQGGNTKELRAVAKDARGMLPSAQEAQRWVEGLNGFISLLASLDKSPASSTAEPEAPPAVQKAGAESRSAMLAIATKAALQNARAAAITSPRCPSSASVAALGARRRSRSADGAGALAAPVSGTLLQRRRSRKEKGSFSSRGTRLSGAHLRARASRRTSSSFHQPASSSSSSSSSSDDDGGNSDPGPQPQLFRIGSMVSTDGGSVVQRSSTGTLYDLYHDVSWADLPPRRSCGPVCRMDSLKSTDAPRLDRRWTQEWLYDDAPWDSLPQASSSSAAAPPVDSGDELAAKLDLPSQAMHSVETAMQGTDQEGEVATTCRAPVACDGQDLAQSPLHDLSIACDGEMGGKPNTVREGGAPLPGEAAAGGGLSVDSCSVLLEEGGRSADPKKGASSVQGSCGWGGARGSDRQASSQVAEGDGSALDGVTESGRRGDGRGLGVVDGGTAPGGKEPSDTGAPEGLTPRREGVWEGSGAADTGAPEVRALAREGVGEESGPAGGAAFTSGERCEARGAGKVATPAPAALGAAGSAATGGGPADKLVADGEGASARDEAKVGGGVGGQSAGEARAGEGAGGPVLSIEACPETGGLEAAEAAGAPASPAQGSASPQSRAQKGAAKGKGKAPAGPAKGAGKGKAQQGSPCKKPPVKPSRVMKALWWNRLNFGKHLKEGASIWDKVEDLIGELPLGVVESRFGKPVISGPPGKADKAVAPCGPKSLQIINDPNLRAGKVSAVRDFPAVGATVEALVELDPLVLSPMRLAILREHFCPTPVQVTQLEECRREHPGVPFADPEEYMWHVSRIPAFKARIDCWGFVREYEERASCCAAGLSEVQRILEAFLTSSALPRLLALVLAVGNYVNGGTSRGQADGFDLETLGKLDAVKDNDCTGRDLRHFVIEMALLGTVGREAQALGPPAMTADGLLLLEELSPALCSVRRALMRDSEGNLNLARSVRVSLEDAVEAIRELVDDCEKQQANLQACLQSTQDPSDPMKLYVAEQVAQAQVRLQRLQDQAKKCHAEFGRLLRYFNHPGMSSADFVLLWDNFFIPNDLVLNRMESFQKQHILPRFCRPEAEPGPDDLLLLWGLCTPEQLCTRPQQRPRVPNSRRHAHRRGGRAPPQAVRRFALRWRSRAETARAVRS